MPELKRNFTAGRMNKDLDERMVPNGEYRDALNIEVNTSEGSNVGTVQTLKGNTALTSLFSPSAVCVGTIADEKNNKVYWFVHDAAKNEDASTTQSFVTQGGDNGDGSTKTITHNIYSDYIMEYDESEPDLTKAIKYVLVEHYKVETTASNDAHASPSDHQHISNLNNSTPTDNRLTGIQVGMDFWPHPQRKTTVIKIEQDDTSTWNGWRIYTEKLATDPGYSVLSSVDAGDDIRFELPKNKRILGFENFVKENPGKVITGINIIDDLLFWTDGLTEPKKINIKRCIYGSQQLDPVLYPSGTRAFPTLLVVNGEQPSAANGRLGAYDSVLKHTFLSYQHTTVIKKSPIDPLTLTMSNTTRPDQDPQDGLVNINTEIHIPLTQDFFFDVDGKRLQSGEETPQITFSTAMDWGVGDTIEWFPEDDDAGFSNEVIAVLIVESILNGDTFTFEVQSINPLLIKPYTDFRVRLQQDDPLFEFKFPRFAYRWKYEDGEYSCYSPFSDVAFLPEEFDYFPKKGHNLGMTNNLRYLVLSGFKPRTMPLDVVDIDILYKESNSPNVYTVDTIKAPSKRVDYLGTDNYSVVGAHAWFGRIKAITQGLTGFVEVPTTLTTLPYLVALSALTGANTNDFFTLEDDFSNINMKIGDVITLGTLGNAGSGTLRVSGMQSTTIPGYWVGTLAYVPAQEVSQISITHTTSLGVVTDITMSPTPTWLFAGNSVTFKRSIAKKPAVYVGDPTGSLQVKTDMIHATVPSNQLLRPYDNVPKSALAQEITGNRVVYGNYVQNYNLTDVANELTKVSFITKLHSRSNIRSNVRYDDRTALVNQNTGALLDWYDPINAINPVPAFPERSLKSLRDYQIGVVYMDEFGRQTPIQTHSSAVKRIPKSQADKYNSLRIKLDPEESTFPEWATHFKFYIKENANEYHNLAMDRFYDAEDGNVWLSFPSAERDKVDEETFLILKKQHDNDDFVQAKARYKILAIENEAPLYVKTKRVPYGIISPPYSATGFPKIDGITIDVPNSFFTGTNLSPMLTETSVEKVVRISNTHNQSRWYDIASITSVGSYKKITLAKRMGVDVAFTTIDNTSTGNIIPGGVSLELAKKEIKILPEFGGRFFVKIHKDNTFEENIQANAPDRHFVVTMTMNLGGDNTSSAVASGVYWGHGKDFWQDDTSNGSAWWIDSLKGVGIHLNQNPPGGSQGQGDDFSQGMGHITSGNTSAPYYWVGADSEESLDMSITWLKGDKNSHWGIKFHSHARRHEASKLENPGTLFRFKGNKTIYRITGSRHFAVENWKKKSGNNNWGSISGQEYETNSNHREKWRVEFKPKLGATGLDAMGQEIEVPYNPFTEHYEGDTRTDQWQKGSLDSTSKNKRRTIEFVEEMAAEEAYSSDNPAIWETEPKENIDVDIYNEASAGLPIKKELDTYRNEIYKTNWHTSSNALSYYNCFSFANGVESNRVRDDFNAVTIDKGPKASTVLAQQYKEEHRKSGLIYSGIYNSTSGVNNLNQFIQAEKITKDINPTYGSIQKLYSKDTNLITFCEDRIIKVLANKDALFNADGNSNVTSTNNVLGAATPYIGDYGISTHPESFAVDQHRAYFTDKSRGVVLRLSQQGLTPISEMGMRDYFKDVFRATNINLLGSYDSNKKLYNLTMRAATSDTTITAVPTVLTGTGTDFIDFADANIIGYIPFDHGGFPGSNGDGTGPFYTGSSVPYAYGVIGNPSTTFTNNNGSSVQTFGQYNANNEPSAGGSGGGYGPNVTQIHLPAMDWYSAAIATRMNALIDALNNCPNGDVYLHVQIQASGDNTTEEMPLIYQSTGFPIVTFKVNSINFTGTRYELGVAYFSGLHGGNIDSYYFWYSTSGCDISGGGDSTLDSSANTSDLGYTETTVSFSEDSKGWPSFKSWLQKTGVSINDKYFTFASGELYQHHRNETRNNFYGAQYPSTLCLLFNDMSDSVKNFSSLSYEGSQSKVDALLSYQNTAGATINQDEYYNLTSKPGWFAESITTDLEAGQIPEFREKEGKWFNFIKGSKVNNLANLDVKQFSTQGIGRLSAISVTVPAPAVSNTLTVQDVGDID